MVLTTGIFASLKEGSSMFTRILSAAAAGALLIGLTAQPATAAKGWLLSNHTEYLTFSAPIALPGVVLAAGTYRFDVPGESGISNGLVRVSSKDGRRIYLTQFARIVNRPDAAKGTHVTFGEAKAGSAPPVNTWFPIGEDMGRQFIYN
jgi:hypothetical protein